MWISLHQFVRVKIEKDTIYYERYFRETTPFSDTDDAMPRPRPRLGTSEISLVEAVEVVPETVRNYSAFQV